MPNGTYGGVRGRKTKVGEKKLLRFPPTRLSLNTTPPFDVRSFSVSERRNSGERTALVRTCFGAAAPGDTDCPDTVFPVTCCYFVSLWYSLKSSATQSDSVIVRQLKP